MANVGPGGASAVTDGVASPPRRPHDDATLQFTREKAVRWFQPTVLAKTGLHVGTSAAIGDFLDKRELQASVPAEVIEHDVAEDESWIDYVADTGDGFDATYSIAWLTAQRGLAVGGLDRASLPRPNLLILGGDEVYPSASSEEYENRFKGPYEASFPWTDGESPKLLAIPGNHDWYDGLTNFMRLFCTRDERWIGARRAVQTHSYFAVKLPHSWWLWGIDIQFDSYIDDPQLRFFKEVVRRMEEEEKKAGGDRARVILCTGKPSWADVEGDPKAFRNLAYFKQETIGDKADLLLSISGDKHHYARYDSVEPDGTISHRITAGGGGAFLHQTHHLDDPLEVPIDPKDKDHTRRHDLRCTYPTEPESKKRSRGAFRLLDRNPFFLAFPAVIYLLLGWSTLFGVRIADGASSDPLDKSLKAASVYDLFLGLVRNPVSILVLLTVGAGLYVFAKPEANRSQGGKMKRAKMLMGFTHFLAQLAVGVLVVGPEAVDLAALFANGGWFLFWNALFLVVLGALAATLTMSVYLWFWCRWFRAHGNEAFSAMGCTDYKNFLRLHIDKDGLLTVYPIGLDRCTKKWKFDPGNPNKSASWLKPAPGAEPRPRLIETPVEIAPAPRPVEKEPARLRGASGDDGPPAPAPPRPKRATRPRAQSSRPTVQHDEPGEAESREAGPKAQALRANRRGGPKA